MSENLVVHPEGSKTKPTWAWFREAVDGWLAENDLSPDIELAYIDTSFVAGAAINLGTFERLHRDPGVEVLAID